MKGQTPFLGKKTNWRNYSQSQFSKRCWFSSSFAKVKDFSVYDPKTIETKWQRKWNEEKVFKVENTVGTKQNFYVLSMFPYPSGTLHMGHVRVYTISDCLARLKRMQGYNVLHPMGWDAFGLPAENAAIERGMDATVWTKSNIENMRSQLQKLGSSFDWEREVSTCDPSYYKWTQQLFLLLFKSGLAYRKESFVNWDPKDETVLANEQVDAEGKSWRSGAIVEKRLMKQWFLKITDYSERLLQDLNQLEGWPQQVKQMQKNWIGKSSLYYFDFPIEGKNSHQTLKYIRVSTTRPDTIYGVTFLALAPEYPSLSSLISPENYDQNQPSINEGIFLGTYVIHPFTKERIPLYVADYVLSEYGTGAVMGVPAHDTRDYEFSKKYNIPIKYVIRSKEESTDKNKENTVFTEFGILINSGKFTGLSSEIAQRNIVEEAKRLGFGGHQETFRLHDWLISRQRYWGAPIPLIYCQSCGILPVPEDQLPVLLPEGLKLSRKGSPLSHVEAFINTTCPKCKGHAKRESDTMDTFVDSSWYFARFTDPKNNTKLFDPQVANLWMPVNVYVGGIEHAILHLLYSRFITKFLFDKGELKCKEPFQWLITQGMVHGKTMKSSKNGRFLKPHEVDDSHKEIPIELETNLPVEICWEKMSKSKYNGVDPDPIITQYGADTVRLFMLFKAPPEGVLEWDINGIVGQSRWLSRIWNLITGFLNEDVKDIPNESNKSLSMEAKNLLSSTHQLIKLVTKYLAVENHSFNSAIAELMKFSNLLSDVHSNLRKTLIFYQSLRTFILLLSPMAPHITSELWELLILKGPTVNNSWAGFSSQPLIFQNWPQADESLISISTIPVVVMIQGKKRDLFEVPVDLAQSEIESLAYQSSKVQSYLQNKKIEKTIFNKDQQKYILSIVLAQDKKK